MIRYFTRRINVLYIFAALCVISCEKDEFEPIEKELTFPKISGRMITPKDMSSDLVVYNGLMEHLSQSMAKSHSGIELDTTHISVIDTDQYTSYTFKIQQDSLERQYLLKNFMLTVVNDTTLIQHLIEYPVLSNGSINVESVDMQRLYGDDLLDTTQYKCGGTSTVWYSYLETYSWNCGGATGNGKHGPGDDTCKAKDGDRAGFKTVTRWASLVVNEEPCEDIDSGNNRNGGGGSTPPDPDAIPDVKEIRVPLNPIDPDEPDLCLSDGNGGCVNDAPDENLTFLDPVEQELNDLINKDTTFVNLKQIINLLKTRTSENVENSMSFYKDLVAGEEVTKSRTSSIERGSALNKSYVYIGSFDFANIHTHPFGTHGMFSFQDIFTLSEMYNALNPIVKDKAVMMLVTDRGEVYALKVNDINKLNSEMTAALNAQTKFNTQQDKLDELTRLLGLQYDTDLNNLEGIFASAFKNFGVSLYKANDANLSGWTKVN